MGKNILCILDFCQNLIFQMACALYGTDIRNFKDIKEFGSFLKTEQNQQTYDLLLAALWMHSCMESIVSLHQL